MATRSPNRRYVKSITLLLLLYVVYNVLVLCRHQWRFQKHLAAKYITWDDFPSSYTDTLRAKDWRGLETFDYERVFTPRDVNGTTRIPPVIHFIWFANLYETRADVAAIPRQGSQAPAICEHRNPRLTVKIWTADEARALLEAHYAWFLPTYDAYRFPIQRVDAFKYFLLWHHGGVYMDMDIECRRSLEPLLPFPAWFPEASPLGVNNDLMAARARHPVVKLMIDNLAARNRDWLFPYLTIFWSTGPQFTGDLLKRWFLRRGPAYKAGASKVDASKLRRMNATPRGTGEFELTSVLATDADEWFVLPQVFYSEEFTFFGHTPGGTWHEDDVAVILWLVAHPVLFWLLTGTLLVSLVVFALRRSRRNRQALLMTNDHEA